MPLNIDLNVPFTFTHEHSISDNDTTIPSNVETQEFEFNLNYPSYLNVEENMNQNFPRQEEIHVGLCLLLK
ncbi:hypothetical protein MTR_3g018760 [Medicago truncatula]|uniref:Uncharacterized protein n=1 Tax=Medicago truncatula TaxID=3880 RepID=G7IW07_MEDTR|nr:hypothetical protein MTR_3g018760 [Medicago truncatula]